ncbi:hypothetical protein [Nostoc sp.]|uniref:hypothetical protein n=1 Tax=Nostoc sp. TaxID=1180 RepID=UPI002FFB5359
MNKQKILSHAPCPMPHAPCPMPHAPCPMPHAPCPMPHAQYLRQFYRSWFGDMR